MIRLKNAWANEAVYSGQWANESANWSKFKNVAGLCPSVSLCLYVCVWLPVFICAFGSLCLCVRLAFCVYVCVWLSVLMCASGSLCLCVRWALCVYVCFWLSVFICMFGSVCLFVRLALVVYVCVPDGCLARSLVMTRMDMYIHRCVYTYICHEGTCCFDAHRGH